MCSFCVRLCGWTRSLCLSALPSNRAPDEVIRTVTGVARLHCLYLAGVSVVRCQIVFTLVVSYSLCQSSRFGGCSRLVASLYFLKAGDSALPGLLHLHCRWYLHLHCVLESAPALPAYLTSTVFWSGQIKTICFHSQLDLELSVPWQDEKIVIVTVKLQKAHKSSPRGMCAIFQVFWSWKVALCDKYTIIHGKPSPQSFTSATLMIHKRMSLLI